MNNLFIKSFQIDWSKLDVEHYVRQIAAIKTIENFHFNNNVTFFVGENGSGKSTLLEAIAVSYGFNAEGGTKNYLFSTYDSHSDLYQAIKLAKGAYRPNNSYFLRAESFYNVATKAEEYRSNDPEEWFYSKSGGKSLHKQSHGESFFSIIQGEFSPYGLFILDEPEAALSISKQLSLLYEIHRLAARGTQFIIATHSPILLGLPNANIVEFSEEGLKEISYEETSSYQLTELFVNGRESLLKNLLDQ